MPHMQTKQDHLQSHQFTIGRLVSALTHGEPDAPGTPSHRFSTGFFGSIMIGALVIAAFTVIGLLTGASTAFRTPGTIVVDKSTGSRFLIIHGELRPVINFASAVLLTGNANPPIASVPASSLKHLPQGLPLGIPGAPDSLPSPTGLDHGAWLVCSPLATGTNSGPLVTVSVGSTPGFHPLPVSHGLLVQGPNGPTYLAWNNELLPIGSNAALTALGYSGVTPLQVGTAWIDALPGGPVLAAPAISGLGNPGPSVGGQPATIGQVFEAPTLSGGASYSVLLSDGLSPLSATEAALILGDPATQAAYPGSQVAAIRISIAELAAARRSATSLATAGYPPSPPDVASQPGLTGDAPCYTAAPGPLAGPAVHVGVASPPAGGISPLLSPGDNGGATADQVLVPPGGGLLAASQTTSGKPGHELLLVTDTGEAYPLPSAQVAQTLGYGNAPLNVPASMLALLPTGPTLSPAAAQATT